MPETIMPLLTGLFLVFAGMLIGYFLWFRDRTQDEAIRLRLRNEHEEMGSQLRKYKSEHESLTSQLSGQQGKLHILQELCDDLVSGREQFQVDRLALESSANESRRRLEEIQSQYDEEKRLRISAEDRLHQERQKMIDRQESEQNTWQSQVSKLQTEILHRNTDIKQMASVNERTTEKLHTAESTIAELKSELASQKSLVETARNNESGLEKEYVSLETSLKNHSELLKESRGQCAAALSAKRLAEESVRDLRGQLEEYKTRLEKMDEVMSVSESTKLRCLSLEQTLENSNDRLAQLETERDKALTAEKEAHESISAMQTRLENQEATIRKMAQKSEELSIRVREEKGARLESESAAKDEHHSLQSRNRELELQLEQSEAELVRLRESHADVDNLKRGRERLAVQLATLEQTHRIHETRFEERTSELQSLRANRDDLAEQLARLRDEHARRESSYEQQLRQLGQLRNERDELANRLVGMERESAESRVSGIRQRDEIQSRISLLVSQRDQAFGELESIKREMEALRTEIEELRALQEQEPVILAMVSGEEVDEEYGGTLRSDDARGKVFVEAPEIRDDLKRISGIATVLEQRLNEFGIYTFKQIMEWKEENIQEFSTLLAFKDRIDRDEWIVQARKFYYEKTNRKAA